MRAIFGLRQQYLIEELEKVQKQATKLISSAWKKLRYEPRLIYLKLPTLKH